MEENNAIDVPVLLLLQLLNRAVDNLQDDIAQSREKVILRCVSFLRCAHKDFIAGLRSNSLRFTVAKESRQP